MANEVLLQARGIRRSYGHNTVLNGIDLTLHQGEVLGFLGLNGAGKSTTIQILAGALGAHAGSVTICGFDLCHEHRRACRHLGYAPQKPPLYEDMLAHEFLAFRGRSYGLDGALLEQAVARACAECGLADVATRLIGHLSPGYQQRLGIAQALVHEPSVLLLDEPTAGLDPIQIRDVRELIRRLGQSRAVLLSTHMLAEIRQIATRVVILHHGAIVFDDVNPEHSGLLRVRFAASLDRGTLERVRGISQVHELRNDAWLIALDQTTMDETRFASFAIASGWGLCELAPELDTLERLFMRITSGDPV